MAKPAFMHLHAHSAFSSKDAIQGIESMVQRAVRWGQPGVALTDHGVMSGAVQLYLAGKKHGIPVFPGIEGYLVDNVQDSKAKRYHFGLLAPTLDGFRALTRLSSLSHTRENFLRYPRLDFSHLADASLHLPGVRDLVLLTGCYFGLVQQTLVERGEAAARQVVEMYASWFPNTVVEVQNHNIEHDGGITDDDIVDALVSIAEELGLPVVATQDSHYLEQRHKEAHNTLKRMVYRQGDANEFPGDSFHFASTDWVREHYTEAQWKLSEAGHAFVLGLHDLSIPPLDKFKPHIPKMAVNPQRVLSQKCSNKLLRLSREKKTVPKARGESWAAAYDRYAERLAYELGMISDLGFADYFLHVLDFVDFCRGNKFVIEARGSANASLVCYLLGITQVDPLQWGLTFERFLSPDRQKPPDIDIDIEDVNRPVAVDYLKRRYGVLPIGNFSALGHREEDDKGSVLRAYESYLRAKLGPAVFNARFGKEGIGSVSEIRKVSPRDYAGIRKLSKLPVTSSYGVHAAGLLLNGSDMKISEYIPTMLVPSSGTTVSQYTMDDLEPFGLLKDDVLGQRTLWAMARCQELMGREDKTDFSWIPMDDPETCRMLSEGRPNNGVFQFEGYSTAKGVQSLGIKNTMDCVLAGAIFRPATADSGVTATYIRRRNSAVLRNSVRYPHRVFEKALRRTYGCVLFQEQVLEIMRGLGLDYAGINAFFKIVKDSGKGATARNVERAREVKKQWEEICEKNGITDREGAWHYIEGYVKYGFNQAHATGYGVRAYRAGYLKTHYPLEYMSAILESVAGKPILKNREAAYVREARRMGIRLLPADIAVSGARWTMDPRRRAITRGLSSIDGVSVAKGEVIAEHGPYESVEALCELLPAKVLTGRDLFLRKGQFIGVMKALKEAGALQSFGIGKDD